MKRQPPPPPPGPKNRDIRGREYNPNPGTVLFIVGFAIFIGVVLLSGCERVTEYKCSTDQIEKAKAQFEWCKQGVTLNLDSKRVDQCWAEATQSHCEVAREYHQVGYEVKDDQP